MATSMKDVKPRWRVSHKVDAVERVIRGEGAQQVAATLGAPLELVEKWHKQFCSAGKNHLRYTSDPDEVPNLDALRLSAQKAFPTRLLHGCNSAASFFCAQFYGKNDVVHLYEMGVPRVTLVDLDAGKLGVMRDLYPADWELIVGDAFDAARQFTSAGRKFDLVVCDPYSTLAGTVAFDHFGLFHSIASKFLLLLYSQEMFDDLQIEPQAEALSNAVARRTGLAATAIDVVKRSSHAGGIYWAVFRIDS